MSIFDNIFSFEEEVKRYTRNLEKAKMEGDKYKEGDSLQGLAICYSAMAGHENPQKAVDYYNQAINIFLQINWSEMFYKASAALGMVYEKLLHDPNGALRIYEYALEHGDKILILEAEKHYRERIVRSIAWLKSEDL